MMYKNIISKGLLVLHILFGFRLSKGNTLKVKNGTLLWRSSIRVEGKQNNIYIDENSILNKLRIKIRGNNNKIVLSKAIYIYEGCEFLIEGDNCSIFIGEKTSIGKAHIFCGESNSLIKIGKDCMLSREVYINTSDFHSIIDIATQKRINPPRDILIEDHVWIGFNTRINKGATLRKDSIVASHALVAGKVYPPNIILAGVPARVAKENITWSREKLPYQPD